MNVSHAAILPNEIDVQPVTILGGEEKSGAYILRMSVLNPMAIRFGRFRQGEALLLAAGEYLYVGSAMGVKGSSGLARRLVRHATRREGAPHAIREGMLVEFARVGLGGDDLPPRGEKRLFWHVDSLLEAATVRLTHVLAIRSRARLEQDLAGLVAGQIWASLPVRGFGASDVPGGTHLFAAAPMEGWWQALVEMVQQRWGDCSIAPLPSQGA